MRAHSNRADRFGTLSCGTRLLPSSLMNFAKTLRTWDMSKVGRNGCSSRGSAQGQLRQSPRFPQGAPARTRRQPDHDLRWGSNRYYAKGDHQDADRIHNRYGSGSRLTLGVT